MKLSLQLPLIRKKNLHVKLIETVNTYGYFLSSIIDEGVCNGVTVMGSFAFLTKEFPKFISRLEYIDKVSPEQRLKDGLNAYEKHKKGLKLTEKEEIILEMPAFIEGIAAFQSPSNIMEGDMTKKFVSISEVLQLTFINSTTAKALMPALLKEGVVLKTLGFYPLTTAETLKFFDKLESLIKNARKDLLLIFDLTVSEGGHAAFISYDAAKEEWSVFDINKPSSVYAPLRTRHLRDLYAYFFSAYEHFFTLMILGKTEDKLEIETIAQQSESIRQSEQCFKLTTDKIDLICQSKKNGLVCMLIEHDDRLIFSQILQSEKFNDKNMILYCILNQRTELLKQLLANGSKLSDTNIEVAAILGNIDILKIVCEKLGIHILTKNPLLSAIKAGHTEAVKYLLKNYPSLRIVGYTDRDKRVNSLLLPYAFYSGNMDLVDYILKLEQSAQINGGNYSPSLLKIAIQVGDYALIEKALKLTNNVDMPTLLMAVKMGKLDSLKLCIQYLPNADNTILLNHACFYGHKPIIQWLLSQNAVFDSDYALELTMKGNPSIELLEFLLLHRKQSALSDYLLLIHLAVEHNKIKVLPWILTKYPQLINHKDKNGRTVFAKVVQKGDVKTVEMFLQADAIFTRQDLDLALQGGHVEAAFLIAQKLYPYQNKKKLFMEVISRALPVMNNQQILDLFKKITYMQDPVFGFIHQQRHASFDKVRAICYYGFFNKHIWQTATFSATASKLTDQFIKNLKAGETMVHNWKEISKINKFVFAKIGNFNDNQNAKRKQLLFDAINEAETNANQKSSNYGI